MGNYFHHSLRKGLFLMIIAMSFTASLSAQKSEDLKFRENGTFKIVQFTDIHFEYNTSRSDTVLTLIKTILAEEKPDLIIVTGDVVCSDNTRKAWLQVTKPFIDTKVPWTITLGNHDDEFQLSRQQIIDMVSKLPDCLTVNGPSGIYGHGNYVLKIQSSKSSKTEALVYCFDSNSYSTNKGIEGYGWIQFDQIEWFRKESDIMTKVNKGIPLPALAFFHIPLPEYKEVIGKETTVGMDSEEPCSPLLNTGLFASMVEKKDVMGVFVGHDHDDNCIGCMDNICLAYGSKTGLDNYGSLEKGARIIVLKEGEREFSTWIRTLNSTPQYKVTYPESFPVKGK